MAETQALPDTDSNKRTPVSDTASVLSEAIAGSLPSFDFSTDVASSGHVEYPGEEHPRVTGKYFVAEDWGEFVEKRDARLCSRCHAFLERLPRIATKLLLKKSEKCEELRATFESLKCSASSGCPLCAMLVMVLAYYPPEERDSADVAYFRCRKLQEDIYLDCKLTASFRRPLKIQLCDTRSQPVPRLLGASTGGNSSVKRAREWYDHCRKFHSECVETAGRTLPTRLLYYKNGSLRLCNSVDLDISTRYATLSHCWGKSPMFKLTMERVQSFQTNIDIKELSRTFQDALQVLAHLELEFLWIDSLCIVQDDPDDWNRECLLMSSVYGHSDITIAAASSTDGSQGCFYERKMPVEQLLHINIVASNSCKRYTITHPPNPELVQIDWLPPSALNNRSPLFSRGWVLQERILTPRLLTFNSSYLYWQCASWSGPEWKRPGIDESQGRHELRNLTIGKDYNWHEVVRVYSRTQLAFPSDRLVAISGVAKRIQKVFPDQYLAGMWRKDLERLLCWSVVTPQQGTPLVYQAPSWSWVSLLPGTRANLPQDPRGFGRLLVQIVNIEMTLTGPDPMGAVTRGVLRVRCETLLCGMAVSGMILSGNRDNFLANFGSVLSSVRLRLDSQPNMADPFPFYLRPVLQAPGNKGGRLYIRGLVLKPTNKCKGEYERIGQFRKDDSPGENRPKIFKKTGSVDFAKLSFTKLDRELLFESSDGEKGPHFITIV